MKLQVRVNPDTKDKIILQAGDFKLNEVYCLTGGYHSGKMIRLNYISPFRQILINSVLSRFVSGALMENNIKINSVIEHLQII